MSIHHERGEENIIIIKGSLLPINGSAAAEL
jgi:hypothetical protein